ncbi:putative ATP-dependent helicase C17A2,12 OS=Schizosaccharomyces pombe (strain 972 / ATCC 24843) GN=SPAC17A2.12 PE=3 SV=1 [Rhizoctonia solani AG-1 IB]|uniref:Putative ATP-dependent helicase C17A2,12 n=1 Tax=Thanatephorus cucumeris (strain AG1-IB / isolate 7/3/14) TaxID=1108050 RepID=A0A0B7F8G3_THACB|nr:putative ATP-dependent helicase C17A2,12 OS=Schizosaccharomyces pombe (strain 972 / ATCC 24843) GN=SPAC17A2.12 PE=3 SV=1 [Rhizoctonia solani AG-1 IB]
MPLPALSRSLLYLFQAMSGQEKYPFECPPWSEPVWRARIGLIPLAEDEDHENVDVDDDPTFLGTTSVLDGLAISPTAIQSIPNRYLLPLLDLDTIHKADSFITHFWKSYRKDSAPPRHHPIEYTMRSLPSDKVNAVGSKHHGYGQYQSVMLGLLNRQDGVVSIAQEVMIELQASPAHIWKEWRYINRDRPARVRVCDYSFHIAATHPRMEYPDIQATLAVKLFGDISVSSRGALLPEYKPTISCLLQRKYESMARILRTSQKNAKKTRQKFDDSMASATQKRTPAALQAATKALLDWRKYAIQCLECDEPAFVERELGLKDLWAELGFDNIPRRGDRAPKVKSTSTIPSDAEMAAAYEYYVEGYCNSLDSLDELPIPRLPSSYSMLSLVDDDEDLGVGHLKDLSTAEIWARMGLPGATQFPFAEPGSSSTSPSQSESDEGAKQAAIPYWHQAVGVQAVVERAFTKHIGDKGQPSLLCDEVGLGKTIQIVGIVSLVRHYYEQQERDPGRCLPIPPFALENKTPFFSGLKHIPNLPSIVISPRTLSNQWVEQWVKFTQKGGFSVVRYSVDQGPLENFSKDPKGDYCRAAGVDHSRASSVVILADISAIGLEAQRCLEPPPPQRSSDAKMDQAKGHPPRLKDTVNTAGSLFAMRFRVAAIDECHSLRNYGHGAKGAQTIASNSLLVVGATATPLFTNETNLATLARVLQLEDMCGEEGVANHKYMLECKKTRKREWDSLANSIIQKAVQDEAEAIAEEREVDSEDPAFDEILQQASNKYSSEEQEVILRMSYIAQDSIVLLRRVVAPIIVRRTVKSLDCNGQPVLDLPPIRSLTAWSPMNKNELEVQARINRAHIEVQSTKKGGQEPLTIKWHNFLMSQKHALVHPLIYEYQTREDEEKLPEGSLVKTIAMGWTKGNIETEASTRMLKVDQIIQHFWDGNPAAVVFNEDGTIKRNTSLPAPLACDEPRKFLMFRIMGRKHVCYDGSMDSKRRQTAVERFTNDAACRIMIISNVGSTGLNLTAASIIIIVASNPVWSGQETNQISGRAHRPGQKRDTYVYTMITPQSVDVALMGYSQGKAALSSSFLTSNKKLLEVYRNMAAPISADDEWDVEVDAGPSGLRASKLPARKRKATDDEGSTNSGAPLDVNDVSSQEIPPKKRSKTSVSHTKPQRSKASVTPFCTSRRRPVEASSSSTGSGSASQTKPKAGKGRQPSSGPITSSAKKDIRPSQLAQQLGAVALSCKDLSDRLSVSSNEAPPTDQALSKSDKRSGNKSSTSKKQKGVVTPKLAADLGIVGRNDARAMDSNNISGVVDSPARSSIVQPKAKHASGSTQANSPSVGRHLANADPGSSTQRAANSSWVVRERKDAPPKHATQPGDCAMHVEERPMEQPVRLESPALVSTLTRNAPPALPHDAPSEVNATEASNSSVGTSARRVASADAPMARKPGQFVRLPPRKPAVMGQSAKVAPSTSTSKAQPVLSLDALNSRLQTKVVRVSGGVVSQSGKRVDRE